MIFSRLIYVILASWAGAQVDVTFTPHPSALLDGLFDSRVYNELNNNQPVPGDWAQIGGDVMLSREDVARIALDRYLQIADAVGIPHNQITRAMLESRLTPAPKDLMLILEGFGKPSHKHLLTHYLSTVNTLVAVNVIESLNQEAMRQYLQGSTPIDDETELAWIDDFAPGYRDSVIRGSFNAVTRSYQNQRCNETFGTFSDVENVYTFFNRQRRQVPIEDIATLLTVRFSQSSNFERHYGTEKDLNVLTYQEYVDRIRETQGAGATRYLEAFRTKVFGNDQRGGASANHCIISYWNIDINRADAELTHKEFVRELSQSP